MQHSAKVMSTRVLRRSLQLSGEPVQIYNVSRKTLATALSHATHRCSKSRSRSRLSVHKMGAIELSKARGRACVSSFATGDDVTANSRVKPARSLKLRRSFFRKCSASKGITRLGRLGS